MDCKEIKPVSPKGNQSWLFIGRTEAEAPIFWPRDVKSRLIEKDPNAGKDWGQEEKPGTEDEMDGIIDSMDMSLSKLPKVWGLEAWHVAVHGVAKSQTWPSDWTIVCDSQQWGPTMIVIFNTQQVFGGLIYV